MCIGKASAWPRLKTPKGHSMLVEFALLLAMSNPATAACTRAGGTPSFVQTDKGEQGMCSLPSGLVCEEWAFFRGECVAASSASSAPVKDKEPSATPQPATSPEQRRD
jgi:putative hemolysin